MVVILQHFGILADTAHFACENVWRIEIRAHAAGPRLGGGLATAAAAAASSLPFSATSTAASSRRVTIGVHVAVVFRSRS